MSDFYLTQADSAEKKYTTISITDFGYVARREKMERKKQFTFTVEL